MNVYVGNRLPSTFQEVEYIQSSGTQYINTGYIPNNNTKVELSMGGWSDVGTYCDLFGVRYAWSDTGRGFMLGGNSNDKNAYAMFGTRYSGSSWYSSFSFSNGNNHTLEMSQSGIYEDGTLRASLSSSTFTSPTNMTIFALNDNGTISEQSAYKLYYFKIWNNGTLVRNFIPCYRKQDNVIGLYDLVNSVFYTNSGSGTFSKGNDVTMTELKNAYIGEVWTPGANTIAYFPFVSDTLDHSGNGVTLSNTQYISKQTLGYKWQFSQGQTGQAYSLHFNNSNAKYIGMWYKVLNSTGNSNICGLQKYGAVGYNTSHGKTNLNNKIVLFTNTSWAIGASTNGLSFNEWHHIAIGYDGSKVVVSKDGVLSTLYNGTGYNFGDEVGIAGGGNNTNFQVLFSNVICESVCWTAQEVLNYYNQTKANYGL